MMYRIFLDTRSKNAYTTNSRPTFALTRSICNVKSVRCVSVQLPNTFPNIVGDNTIDVSIDGGDSFQSLSFLSTTGFYSPEDVVDAVDGTLQDLIFLVFGTPDTSCVSLDSTRTRLQWTLPVGVQVRNNEILGLTTPIIGTGTTILFLSSPMGVSFVCPQLQATHNVYAGDSRMTQIQPFVSMPLTNGYGAIESYVPEVPFEIDCGGQTLSTLDVRVVDSLDGRVLTELPNWTMELLVTV